MKNSSRVLRSVFILLLLVDSTSSFSQTRKTETQVEWITGGSHDFGSITQNEPVSFDFEFVNNATHPVTIEKVKPGCHCTVVAYTQELILPGKNGLVRVTYNARTPGKFRKTISVSFGSDGDVALVIEGEVIQK